MESHDKSLKAVLYMKRLAPYLAVLLVGLGLLVVLGWALDIPVLKSVHPNLVSMKANTAVGIMVSGITLLLLLKYTRTTFNYWLSLVLASFVIVLGLVSVIEYVFGVYTGLDSLFFTEHSDAVGTYLPGRMSPNAAIGFLIAGTALISLIIKNASSLIIAQLCASFLALLSVLPFLGYGFRIDPLYGYAHYTQMAVHTSAGFFILSLSVLFSYPDQGIMTIFSKPGPGGYLARRLLPLTIMAPISLVLLWILAERLGLHGLSSDISLFFVLFLSIAVFLVWKSADSINKIEDQRLENEKKATAWYDLMQYIIQHDPSAIAVHDKDLKYIFVSQRYLDDYGVKEKDLIGKYHYDVFPDIPEKWKKVHQRALQGEIIRSEEDHFVRTDGKIEFTRWECRPWRDKDGHIGGIILYTEVITNRKMAEMNLAVTAAKLETVLRYAGDGIFSVDNQGKTTMINQAALDMLGYEENELTDRFIHGIHHHTHVDGTPYHPKDCSINKALTEGRISTIDHEVFWKKDGSSFPVEYVSSPIYVAGKAKGAVVSFRDITERKRSEGEIKRLNTRLYDLVAAVKELSIGKNLHQIRKTMALYARKLSGADGATFVVRDNGYCNYLYEDAIEPLFKGKKYPMEKCITGWVMLNKKSVVIEDIYADDRIPHQVYKSTFVKSLASFPINQQEPRAAIAVYWARPYVPAAEEQHLLQTLADAAAIALENVDLVNELEQRVERRTKALESTNKELEAFTYSVSHDLRSPLRAIDGFSRILLEDYGQHLDQDAQRVCQVIRDNTRNMGKLIDDLLAFSRLSRKEITRETIDMRKLVYSMYHEVTTPEQRENIDFVLDEIYDAKGDATMIRQVWSNLLSNAIKFSASRKKPSIHISSEMKDGFFHYQIRDNGVGFDMNYVDKIFGVFQRLHSANEFEGTGVGLAIVHRVIYKHGGQVGAEGIIDKGAVISFSLPEKILE